MRTGGTGALACGLLASCALAQVAAPGATTGVERHTLQVDRWERVYYVYRPKGKPNGPYPVVLVLHGGGGQALGMRRVGFEPPADDRGFAVLYPEGHNRGWNDGRLGTRIERRAEGVDDVAFFRALIDRLIADKVADPARIYATGVSNGGFMSYRIGCDLAGRVAALAPVVANMPADRMELCRPARPIPVFIINGTKDSLVPWDGGAVAKNSNGGMVVSVDKTLELWRRLDGCEGAPAERLLPDKDPDDRTRTTEFVWSRCAAGVEVRLYRVEGGGHGWHGSPERLNRATTALLGPISNDFSGAEEIWRFFSRYSLGSAPEPPF